MMVTIITMKTLIIMVLMVGLVIMITVIMTIIMEMIDYGNNCSRSDNINIIIDDNNDGSVYNSVWIYI